MPKHTQLLRLLCLTVLTSCSSPNTPLSTPDVGVSDFGSDAPGPTDDGLVDLEADTAVPDDGCNPIAREHDCLLPFPSDVFLNDGVVELGDALPRDKDGDPIRAFDAHPADGFSIYPAILFTFGVELDGTSLVAPDNGGLTADSATLLIDAESGEAIPHFSELYTGNDEEVQNVFAAIRPHVRLKEGRRYIVAVQSVRTAAGDAALPPASFRALRDGEVADRYDEDIFGPLQDFGVDRGNLQLAWDFTTRSRDNLMGPMLSVREKTLQWLDNNTPTVTITEVREGADLGASLRENTFRQVEGYFNAPLWMNADAPGATLPNPVVQNGEVEVPFSLTIPKSVGEDDAAVGPFIQYGHGFFGSRDEVLSFVQSEFGNQYSYVMGAVEWSGMSVADRNWVVSELSTDPATAFGFAPRVHQGMANQLVFTEVIRTVLTESDALKVGAGRTAYDPDRTYFLGISQGHILGGTFFALSPSIERAVLSVGGASFGLILSRSYAFLLYERVLAQWMEPAELLKFEAVAPQALDLIDPITYAPLILAEPLPGAVPKQVLLQAGIGDAAVPNVATELHARAIGIPLVTPTPASIPFIDEAPAPASSGLVMFDFGVSPNTARAWKPVNADTVVHEGVRRFGGARGQIDLFFRPEGMVEDTCAGPCVVE